MNEMSSQIQALSAVLQLARPVVEPLKSTVKDLQEDTSHHWRTFRETRH